MQEEFGLPAKQRLETALQDSNLVEKCCTTAHWPARAYVFQINLLPTYQLILTCTVDVTQVYYDKWV